MATTTDSHNVDWALEKLLDLDRSFDPPSQCGEGRCQDLFPQFIYIVVVPAAALLLILTVIFCSLIVGCCVSRKRRKAANANAEQLADYEAIRRASCTLRRMSHNNSNPMLGSRSGSISLVRNDNRRRGFRPRDTCHSAPGTLQRHHRNRETVSLQDIPREQPPPPPYGIPAEYLLANHDDDDAFWAGPEVPLQDLQGREEEDAEDHEDDDHQNHHQHRRHRRRQRPYSAANGYMTR